MKFEIINSQAGAGTEFPWDGGGGSRQAMTCPLFDEYVC